ncbi:MAG: response regulator [Thiolinea sp.]
MTQQTVFIIEDEEKIAELLADYLKNDGFNTHIIGHGNDAVAAIEQEKPDFVILDYMLPGKDGLTICKEVRRFSNVPIMMLTAKVDEIDRLLGLKLGADDYVCKPFLPREVVARVHAILRRTQNTTVQESSNESAGITYRDITIYPEQYRCVAGNHNIELTPVEFRLLLALASKPGRVFSRDQLIDQCYTDNRIISDRTIDSHLKNLRRKLAAVCEEDLFHSVYGVGYKLE